MDRLEEVQSQVLAIYIENPGVLPEDIAGRFGITLSQAKKIKRMAISSDDRSDMAERLASLSHRLLDHIENRNEDDLSVVPLQSVIQSLSLAIEKMRLLREQSTHNVQGLAAFVHHLSSGVVVPAILGDDE